MPEGFPMDEYWLMPAGLLGVMTTVFWSEPRTALAAERRPFGVLLPGKAARTAGEHAFWRGALWGRTVALQGDSGFTKYDLFVEAEEGLQYWGTFRGNDADGSEESHSFASPFSWMGRVMRVGDFKQQRITDSLFDPRLRRETRSAELVLRVEIVAHHESWQDPDSGNRYPDVLEVHYWGRYPEVESREVYHLAKGLGTVRFETFNPREPSGVRRQWAESFQKYAPPAVPLLPWFDPFDHATHVSNGLFQDLLGTAVEGGAVSDYARGWAGSSSEAVITMRGADVQRAWRVALGGSTAVFIACSDWIPVAAGRRYRLSGRVWRSSPDDRVYLDFADGAGRGGSFDDAQAQAAQSGRWERVSTDITVRPHVTAIKVRCVRDGANEGAAYCDEVTLQRLD